MPERRVQIRLKQKTADKNFVLVHALEKSIILVGRFKPPKLCATCNNPLTNRERKYCSYSYQYTISNRMKLGTQKIFIAKDIGDFPIENIGYDARKMRVLKEQNFSCNGCGLSTWREKTITLELEHKDGNSKNNIRENLEILCPNCHSQTDTWRGRNKRVYSTDEQMIDAIKNNKSLRQALESLGMAAKGGNYKRISKLAKEISIH